MRQSGEHLAVLVRPVRVLQVEQKGGKRHFGYGLYVEGDTTTKYFDTLEACKEAIDRDAHWFWKTGQSDGPNDVPEKFEDLPAKYRGLPAD